MKGTGYNINTSTRQHINTPSLQHPGKLKHPKHSNTRTLAPEGVLQQKSCRTCRETLEHSSIPSDPWDESESHSR